MPVVSGAWCSVRTAGAWLPRTRMVPSTSGRRPSRPTCATAERRTRWASKPLRWRSPGNSGPRRAGDVVSSAAMSDVTHILAAIDQGDPHAAAHLLPLVYDELRRLAAAQLAHE